jgi:hypothetical protein
MMSGPIPSALGQAPELKVASEVDEAPLRAGFVAYAKAWADEAGSRCRRSRT